MGDREITPEDYEMLCKLDQNVKPRTVDLESNHFKTAGSNLFLGQTCSICLAPFEKSDDVNVLLCGHLFHRDCISKWLGEHSRACPLCGEDAVDFEAVDRKQS